MKTLSYLLLFVFLGTFGVHSLAQAEEKIALVSLQRALNEVEEGKRAKTTLKADFDAKQKQLEALKADLKKMKDDVDKQKMVLSEEALKTKSNEIQTKFLELQQKAMEYEQELKKKEAESADKILTALKTLVLDLGKKNGYDIIYENSAEVVLYSSKGIDITPELIKVYNAQGGAKK